jgi:hypothetical protein
MEMARTFLLVTGSCCERRPQKIISAPSSSRLITRVTEPSLYVVSGGATLHRSQNGLQAGAGRMRRHTVGLKRKQGTITVTKCPFHSSTLHNHRSGGALDGDQGALRSLVWRGKYDIPIPFSLDLLITQGKIVRRWEEEQAEYRYCLPHYPWAEAQPEQNVN